MPPARSGPPDPSPDELETLALFMQAVARRTGIPVTHPYAEAMAVAFMDATPYLADIIDFGFGNVNLWVERGWIASVSPARSYRSTPRPKGSAPS